MAPLSHICQGCGAELARVRAPLDPVYGLRVVVCPRCAAACVRRLPGASRKRVLRLVDAVSGLLVNALAGALLLLWSVGVVLGLARTLDRAGEGPLGALQLRDAAGRWIDERVVLTAALAVLSVAAGAWLASGLAHWRRWLAFVAWTAALVAAVSIGPLVFALRAAAALLMLGSTPRYGGPGLELWATRMGLVAGALAVALGAGLPLGCALRRLEALARRRLLRRIRRRARARRWA